MKVGRIGGIGLLALLAFSIPDGQAGAETLRSAVEGVLQRHDRVLAAKADVGAGEERVSETFKSGFLPTLTLSGQYGHERRMQKAPGTDTDLQPREFDVRLSQLLFDFGKAYAAVDVARLNKDQLLADLETAQQNLILDTATAYYQMRKTNDVLKYSKQSVDSIKRQGEVEDVRVALGRGYSSDVLQVKMQLAGARAREVQATGAVAQAQERVRTVFLQEPTDVLKYSPPDESFLKNLPKTVDDAVAVGVQKNPQLNKRRLTADMREAQKRGALRNNFFPTFQAIIERKFKDKISGVDEFEDETYGRVEMSYPLNLGLSGLNSVAAAGQDLESAKRQYEDTRRLIEEQARVAWHNLNTARANAELLNNQANIAQKFLELAREERKLDKRSLLEVLTAETALINARADATAAETDVIIAGYTLLQAMGALDTAALDSGNGPPKRMIEGPVVPPPASDAAKSAKPAADKKADAPKSDKKADGAKKGGKNDKSDTKK
ncbi:MAG: TolC family protein [Magnetococcales bacterium]|nr:TolC family protein [Magnetococcales bacterium]